ncbi:MAG: hypothetical protein KC621_21070, partial [Myxococcales bacterium]|nr:hypothetical protein [Myxococcales bacterium]
MRWLSLLVVALAACSTSTTVDKSQTPDSLDDGDADTDTDADSDTDADTDSYTDTDTDSATDADTDAHHTGHSRGTT